MNRYMRIKDLVTTDLLIRKQTNKKEKLTTTEE